jgi:regulator of sigma E protease
MGVLLFLVVLIIVVTIHELGHFIAARYSKMHVEEFGIGFPPRAARIGSYKGTPITLNWLPLGGFVKIAGENGEQSVIPAGKRRFGDAPKRLQALVLISGVLGNILLALVLFPISFMIGVPHVVAPEQGGVVTVTSVLKNSPASSARFKVGDQIISIAGEKIITPDQAVKKIQSDKNNEPLLFEINRKGEVMQTSVVPSSEGESVQVGIALGTVAAEKYPFFKSIGIGIVRTGQTLWGIVIGLGQLVGAIFGHNKEVLQGVAGPVGIAQMTGIAAKVGFGYFLYFVALISANLAVINLIPVPALDGGRLLMVAIETVARKKLSSKVVGWVTGISFLLLILLIIFITVHDIRNLF